MTVAPAAARGYRDFVRPGHPLLARLFPGSAPQRTNGGERALAATLDLARRRFRYRAVVGRRSFDELQARLDGGGGPLELNCLNSACILVARLRELGFSADEVFVVPAGRRSNIGAGTGADFHAWVLVRLAGGMRWIDTADLSVSSPRGQEILAAHHVYAMFNDQHVYGLESQKRRLLLDEPPTGRNRLYLFGHPEAALSAAVADPAFQQLVGRLAAGEPLPAGDAAEGWLEAGLLATRDRRLVAGPKLVLVPERPERELFALTAADIDRYLGVVAATVPRLRAAFERTTAAHRWSWSEVCHAVVAGMLLDLSVGRGFDIQRRVRRERGASVVWAFERVSARHAVGVYWAETASGDWAAGQLWHLAVRQPRVRLGRTMVETLGAAVTGGSVAASAPETLYLRFNGVLQGHDGGWQVTWPAFPAADAELLSAPLREGGDRLLAEAIQPAMARLADHPWWRRAVEDDAYRHAVLRLTLDYGTDRVFDAGLLPEPPLDGEVPVSWGRWLWLGRRGDALPRRRDALAGERPARRAR